MRIIYSPLVAIFFSIFVGFICVSLYLNANRIRLSEHSVKKLETEVTTIEIKVNQKISEAIAATSSAEKERMYRDQLLMQKPGEFVVQVPELPSPQPTPSPVPSVEPPISQWKKLLF